MTTPRSGSATAPRALADCLPHAANTTGSESDGKHPLLCYTDEARRCGIVPDKPRSRSKIDQGIRAKIRMLCDCDLPWPAFFCGGVGSGKTCAALCLCDAALGGATYYTTADLVDRIHQASYGELREDDGLNFRARRVRPHDVWHEWGLRALAVLDELGTRTPTDSQRDVIQAAIDKREGRPLVVISNLRLPELAEVCGDRIASRLAAGTVLDFGDDDRRVA